jgi:hypothetical protein
MRDEITRALSHCADLGYPRRRFCDGKTLTVYYQQRIPGERRASWPQVARAKKGTLMKKIERISALSANT